MKRKRKKKSSYDSREAVLKAMKKANRELQFERNGGGHFVAGEKIWKNKKKYDRSRDRKRVLADIRRAE